MKRFVCFLTASVCVTLALFWWGVPSTIADVKSVRSDRSLVVTNRTVYDCNYCRTNGCWICRAGASHLDCRNPTNVLTIAK